MRPDGTPQIPTPVVGPGSPCGEKSTLSLSHMQVSERLGTWCEEPGLSTVQAVGRGQSPGPTGSQGEDTEGGGEPDPRTEGTLVVPGQDDHVQDFLTPGSQRAWGPGEYGGVPTWRTGQSRVLPGV